MYRLRVLTKFPVMRKMLMYLFWIYIVLKVKQISDYESGMTKKDLLEHFRMKLR